MIVRLKKSFYVAPLTGALSLSIFEPSKNAYYIARERHVERICSFHMTGVSELTTLRVPRRKP